MKYFFSDHVPGSLGICKSLLCSSISLTILRVAELEMSPGIGLFWFCLWKSILIEKNKQGSANKKFEKKNQKFTSKNSFRMHQLFGSNWLQRFRACFSAKCLRPIFTKGFGFRHPVFDTFFGNSSIKCIVSTDYKVRNYLTSNFMMYLV